MNTTDIRDTKFTQAEFWMVYGPITIVVVAVALLFAFYMRVLKMVGLERIVERGELARRDHGEEMYLELRRRQTARMDEDA
jgi:hypothetical protein